MKTNTMTTPKILQQTFRNANGIRKKQSVSLNMMILLNWYLMGLLLLLQINTSDAAKFKGDPCISKNQPGICKEWSACPVIKILIDRGEYSNREVVTCGFEVREELICCPQVTAETKIENNTDADDRVVVLTTTTPKPERDFWMDLLDNLNQTTAAPDFWQAILATTTTTTSTTMRPLMVGNQRLNESSEFFDLNALLSGTNAGQTSDFSGTNNQRRANNNQNNGFISPGNNNRGVNLNTGPVNFNQSPNNQRGNIGGGQQNNFRGNNGNNGQRGQLSNLREVATNENGSNRNFLAQNTDLNRPNNRPNNMMANLKADPDLDSLIKDVFDTNSDNFEQTKPSEPDLDSLITNIFDIPQTPNTQNIPNSQAQGFQQPNAPLRQLSPQLQPQSQPVVAQTWPQQPVQRPEFDPIQTVNQNLIKSGMDIVRVDADRVQNSWQQFRQQPQTNFRGNNGRGNNGRGNNGRGQQNGNNRNFFGQNNANQNRHFKFPGNSNNNNPNIFFPNNNNLQNPSEQYTQNPSPNSWGHNQNNRQPQGFQQQNAQLNQFETEPSTNSLRQPVVVQTWPQDPLHRPEYDPIQVVNQNLVNSGMSIVKAEADQVQNMWLQQQQPQFGGQQNLNQFVQQQPQSNQLMPSQFGQQLGLQTNGPKDIRSVEEPSFGNTPNIQSPPINILDPFKPFEFRPSPEDDLNNSLSPNQKTTVKPNGSTDRPAVRACRRIEKGLNASLTIHILGGTPVGLGEMPHMVGIGYSRIGGEDRPPYDIRCGGTLIDTRYVLTAAHCVSDINSVPSIVRLGVVNNTEGANMRDAVEIKINRTFIHDDYATSSAYNDIAILELERPIIPNDIVYPVCLHTDMADPDTTKKLWVSGWGVYNVTTRSFSNILLKAPLYTAPLESCNQSYVDYTLDRKLREGVRRTQICAVYEGKEARDTCQGDSGGPLQMVVDESLKQYRLIGIVSAGFSCGIPIPSLYTRVAAFLDFIEQIVWPNGGD